MHSFLYDGISPLSEGLGKVRLISNEEGVYFHLARLARGEKDGRLPGN